MFWSEQPFFVSIHNGARLRHLARREVSVQVRARRLREHEVVRAVAGAHPPFGPDHLRYVEPVVLSWAPGEHCNSHQARDTGQDTLVVPCLRCGSLLTSRSVAAAAASSLMRFSPGPSCRGDTANPWLESAFITHFGCVSRHRFVCFPQSIVIACVSRRLSSLLVFLLGFSGVSSLLVCLCFFLVSVVSKLKMNLHCCWC